MKNLQKIQAELKVPKSQLNKFGGYSYRSCEDIVEAAKIVLSKYGYILTISDEIVEVGGRIYVKATATISDGNESISTSAFAREPETQKGMSDSQVTGAASSYARKYALNGLFAIDDTADSDATNKHEVPTDAEKQILRNLVFRTSLTEEQRDSAFESIEKCVNYETYQKIQFRLEDLQLPLDQVTNPTQKEISNHIKKLK
jgi:hypothetical protein